MRTGLLPTLALSSMLLAAPLADAQTSLDQPFPARTVPKPAGMEWSQKHGTVHFNTNIGSFKLLGNSKDPVEGTLDMVFDGTVLISNLAEGSILEFTGNIRKEIDDKDVKKTLYFGKGRMTLTGKWRAVQFFGRDLRATFNGFGSLRLVGEFDQNLDTGFYWFPGDREKTYFATSLITVNVPKSAPAKPRVIFRSKSGG